MSLCLFLLFLALFTWWNGTAELLELMPLVLLGLAGAAFIDWFSGWVGVDR